MDWSRVYKLLEVEAQCVRRASTGVCQRECDKCDLVQKDTDLIEMYHMAQFAVKQLMKNEDDGK